MKVKVKNMNNAYSHKKAILTHLKNHFYLGIVLGLLILAVFFMFLPYVSINSHTTISNTNGDTVIVTDTIITSTLNGFNLAFGSNASAVKTINNVVNDTVYSTGANFGLIFSFIACMIAIIAIAYVYIEEKYYALAFLAAALLLISSIVNFATLGVCGLKNVEASSEHTYYSLHAGPILNGMILLCSSALIVVDYFLVYAKTREDSSFVKYKQELVDNDTILSVRHLKVFFPMGGGRKLKAVHDISFDIKKGECFGLVGESGCGKTTTGRSIIKLHHITSGSIYFKGYRIAAGSRWNEKEIKWTRVRTKAQIKDLLTEQAKELENVDSVTEEGKAKTAEIKQRYQEKINELKAHLKEVTKFQKSKITQIKYDDEHANKKLMSKMQMIFQDPIDSLDPRMTVEDIIQEGLKIQGYRNRAVNHKKACEVLEEVGLISDYCSRYPNEFSGGQRQRIGIARAVVMNPEFMICDEPISALDVSIRAQIINLLNDLKVNYGLTLMFIAHDLSVVKYFCDRIAVMYFGEMVELATSDELFLHPLHPYTRSLLSAIPKPDPYYEQKRVRIIYNPKEEHDYSVEKPKFVEILPGHFVLANSVELEKYKEMIKEDDIKYAKEEAERKAKGLEF